MKTFKMEHKKDCWIIKNKYGKIVGQFYDVDIYNDVCLMMGEVGIQKSLTEVLKVARDALYEYGHHKPQCKISKDAKCTCGLDKAIARIDELIEDIDK
jgi:hypothetical protein